MNNLTALFEAARAASTKLNRLDDATRNSVLLALADEAEAQTAFILAENSKDLARMDSADPKYDRLLLTETRIADIASDMRRVAALPSPLGVELEQCTRPNGMTIRKVTVPFGVIGIIYEARPNVSFDVFSLCFKAGSASILKGGSDAIYSNTAIVSIIKSVLERMQLDTAAVTLLPPDREATTQLLGAVGMVDLIIPRGSRGLIDYVRDNARVPVIETGAGICHTYFDSEGDVTKGAAIINNAKTRRVSVCNALDCLLIHTERLAQLPELCAPLAASNVVIYADPAAYTALQEGGYPAKLLQPATPDSYGTEFMDYKMSVKSVESLDEALAHIAKYSSRHSECIVSESQENQELFLQQVDAACVYSNVSTAFTDGGQFGFGAEIGISTQKLHARGPMALREITTYKYEIRGEGQVR